MELIHYGYRRFVPELFKPIKNADWASPKPLGGLWTSPVDSKWGWVDWNRSEEFVECHKSNSFTLRLKDEAKVLVIDKAEDLLDLPVLRYGMSLSLDFEAIAKEWDAIWLTNRGQIKTHRSYPIDLFGWDCETVLILNQKCIKL